LQQRGQYNRIEQEGNEKYSGLSSPPGFAGYSSGNKKYETTMGEQGTTRLTVQARLRSRYGSLCILLYTTGRYYFGIVASKRKSDVPLFLFQLLKWSPFSTRDF